MARRRRTAQRSRRTRGTPSRTSASTSCSIRVQAIEDSVSGAAWCLRLGMPSNQCAYSRRTAAHLLVQYSPQCSTPDASTRMTRSPALHAPVGLACSADPSARAARVRHGRVDCMYSVSRSERAPPSGAAPDKGQEESWHVMVVDRGRGMLWGRGHGRGPGHGPGPACYGPRGWGRLVVHVATNSKCRSVAVKTYPCSVFRRRAMLQLVHYSVWTGFLNQPITDRRSCAWPIRARVEIVLSALAFDTVAV